jgi:hypothetical protein
MMTVPTTKNKISPFTTSTLDVTWAHLHTPDTKFGEDSANHNITVVVDKELQDKLNECVAELGATKINGMREDTDGRLVLKAKSKMYIKDGISTFPCRDAQSKETAAVAFGGDKVRLRLSPALLSRDSSLSLYLNGVQIIEKEERTDNGGFEPTDGFDGSGFIAPSIDDNDDDLPI